MKKQIGLFTAILFAVSTLMVSCSSEVHEHTFAEEWTYDETNHWHAATCGCSDVELKKTEHTFGDWTITKEPTEEAEGSQEKSCSVCEHKVTEVIAKLEHTHTFGEWKVTKEPTEEAKGSKERVCDVCKYKETAEIAQLDHKHVAGESWKKDDNNHWKECTVCKEKLESAEHEYEWTVTKEATCTEEGTKTGTCEVCKKEVTEKIDAKEHSYSESWKKDDNNHWKECTGCKEQLESAEHEYEWIVTKEATCTDEGSKTGTCKVCKKEVTEKIDIKEHSYSESRTKDASGHWYECVCGAKKDFEEHTYDIRKVLQEPKCTQEGKKTVYCTVCLYEKEETIPEKGHSFGIWEITTKPTGTESGQMQRVCKECGETVTKELQPVPERFVLVEAGTFQMGSNKGKFEDKPVHEVTITKPFYMGKYEVTQAEYEKYCSYTGTDSPSSGYGDGDDYPAYYVSWYDAIVYCNKRSMAEGLTPCYSIDGSTVPDEWGPVPTSSDSTWDAVECNWNANGYRLPTEAEWEYAARAGDNTVDSLIWSGTSDENELGKYAWYHTNSRSETHIVGTKKANAFDLYDMSGNVWEWCWNRFISRYDETEGNYDTETEGGSDPTGSSAGSKRINRGGGWGYDSESCTVFYRAWNSPSFRYDIHGFRLVRLAN